jgi:hypothetical protein
MRSPSYFPYGMAPSDGPLHIPIKSHPLGFHGLGLPKGDPPCHCGKFFTANTALKACFTPCFALFYVDFRHTGRIFIQLQTAPQKVHPPKPEMEFSRRSYTREMAVFTLFYFSPVLVFFLSAEIAENDVFGRFCYQKVSSKNTLFTDFC